MKKADAFSFPCEFTGVYPHGFAGYTFLQWTKQNAYHPGIDWNWGGGSDDAGKPVQAIANGTCVHTSEQDGIGYGEIVVLRHELSDGIRAFIKERYGIDTKYIYSFYAHLKDSNVVEGQEVSRGDLIGWIGTSGTSAYHLHQELYVPIPGTSWRYWATLAAGWTVEKLKKYYIDTYDLIINQPVSNETIQIEKEIYTKLVTKSTNRDEMWTYLGLPLDPIEVLIDKAKAVIEGFKNLAIGLQRQLSEAIQEVKNREEQVDRIKQANEASAKTQEERINAAELIIKTLEGEVGVYKDQAERFAKEKGQALNDAATWKTKFDQAAAGNVAAMTSGELFSYFIKSLFRRG